MRVHYLILTMLIVLVLAGCGTNANTERAALATGKDWGSIEQDANDPLVIGVLLDLSSPGISNIGDSQLEGIEDALDNYDAEGDRFSVSVVDSTCDPEIAAGAANQFARAEDVVAVIGDTCSEVCNTVAPILEAERRLFISAACGSDMLTDQLEGYSNFVRTIYSNRVEGKVIADFVFEELGSRRAAIIEGSQLDSREIADAFEATFESRGGQVLAVANMDAERTTVGSTWNLIEEVEADIIILSAAPEQSLTLLNGRSENIQDIPVVVNRNLRSTWLLERVFDSSNIFASGPFLDDAYDNYGYAFGYDAVALIVESTGDVAIIDDEEITIQLDRYQLHNAVISTAAYPGLSGSLTCTPTGDCSDRRTSISEVQNLQWETVYVSR